MHSYREPPPKQVVYMLTVYLAGTMDDEGPLYRLSTETALPMLAVGDEIDPAQWPEPWFRPEFLGRPLTVVNRAVSLRDLEAVVSCECVLTVNWSSDADPPEVVAANHEAERQRRRAEFFAEVAGDQVSAAANRALDACAAAICASLSAEPAQWGDQEAASAWHEAAGIVQAINHLLLEMMTRELYGRADGLIRKLPITDRVALWLHSAPEETEARADMWDRDDLRHFDPLTAYPGALDEVHQRIVSQVLGQLGDVSLSAAT